MGRSVVLAGAARCLVCSLPHRWCTCGLIPPVESPLAVHLLIHRGERHKPSSTGRLVGRTVIGAVSHVYQRETHTHAALGLPADAVEAGRLLWILHPTGDPLPASPTPHGGQRASRQPLLLLDGTWRQAREMLRSVEGMGTCVRLPATCHEPSRYWLRDQPGPAQLSTAEALMGVFHSVGAFEAERRLRSHFELHVYATLLARGKREMAERYLGHSPLLAEASDAIDRLHARDGRR